MPRGKDTAKPPESTFSFSGLHWASPAIALQFYVILPDTSVLSGTNAIHFTPELPGNPNWWPSFERGASMAGGAVSVCRDKISALWAVPGKSFWADESAADAWVTCAAAAARVLTCALRGSAWTADGPALLCRKLQRCSSDHWPTGGVGEAEWGQWGPGQVPGLSSQSSSRVGNNKQAFFMSEKSSKHEWKFPFSVSSSFFPDGNSSLSLLWKQCSCPCLAILWETKVGNLLAMVLSQLMTDINTWKHVIHKLFHENTKS